MFPHFRNRALGSYRNSPFVTGSHYFTNSFDFIEKYQESGLKTEILDVIARKWIRAKDYPFSNGHM